MVVSTMTAVQIWLTTAGRGSSMRMTHTMVAAVFTLRGHHPQAGHGELPDDDDEQRPGGHLSHLHEPQHGGGDQALVRQGVHELAEVGDLVIVPGNIAVQGVGDAGGGEDGQRPVAGIGHV